MVEYINAILDELRQGLEWDYVTSGEAALDLIHRRSYFRGDAPYSLVITDIFLEGEASGLDVWLDCQEKYKTMPFAVTSSLSHDRYSSFLRGVNNCPVYLPKPLSVDRFASLFREYL
jgi:DNA-binding NtrC family response regulator